MDTATIKVAVFDRNPRSRKRLVKILAQEADLDVVAAANASPKGINAVEAHKPDVILFDRDNPFTDGLEDTEMIISRFPDARLIILSKDAKRTVTATSCLVGACFHLCRGCSTRELLSAVRGGIGEPERLPGSVA